MRERRERRMASPDVAAAAASPQEQRVAQLERLAQLRESGILTDEELAEEKRRVLESA
jgi:Short C-terminal domain